MDDIYVTVGDRVLIDESSADRRDVASIQKSVVSVLVGIAIARGELRLDDTVTSHLGDGWTGGDDVTIFHLLSMTSGLGNAMEFVTKPGEAWNYNLIVYPTTKRVLRAATGRALEDLTVEYITGPLGMTESSWEPRVWDGSLPELFKPAFVYPDGTPMEAFVSHSRDLEKFGRAVMGGCVGMGLDESYREAMTQPSQFLNPQYGLLWWVRDGYFAALGAGDQCCVCMPEHDIVAVRTGESQGSFDVEAFIARARAAS